MKALRVGIVGWRGMVGSVLLDRMQAEGDFAGIEPVFFSTSQAGGAAPVAGVGAPPLVDASDLRALQGLDVILTCQGGDWTLATYPALRAAGWRGYWLDAASALRMDDEAVIVLDPVNRAVIDRALAAGTRTFAGGNCTVSLMLLGIGALFERGWVQWVSTMTYQAASGAGARHMRELVAQMQTIGEAASDLLADPAASALDIDRRVQATLDGPALPTENFGAPLAASLIPWIDIPMPGGETREEYKGFAETNKILGTSPAIPVDGICVRVGAMRSHAQAMTIKLNADIPLADIEAALASYSPWTRFVPNDRALTAQRLTPAATSGSLDVPVGRVRKLRMGPDYLTAFTCGDQLLWGAAEPLRRMLRILREHVGA